MKPVIRLIGIGDHGLEKGTLETYRALTKAQKIYLGMTNHPTIQEMEREGFPLLKLLQPREEEQLGPAYLGALLTERILKEVPCPKAVLVLPGRPLKEGKLITAIIGGLKEAYNINLDGLPQEGALAQLQGIMEELRSPWGCLWDREQTHESLRKYLIEEAYEVIDAIDGKNMNNLAEELGDLLLQIVFHAQIAQESKAFTFAQVVQGISEKMIRRHPHVFGLVEVGTTREVLENWEEIKKLEKSGLAAGTEAEKDFFRLPKGLPALQMAEDSQHKAAKVHFDWQDHLGPLQKVYEELEEVQKEIGHPERLKEELGDLLFAVVNLARKLEVHPEEALREGTRKFQTRFRQMLRKIQEEKLQISHLTLEEMDYYWEQVKKEEKSGTYGLF